MDRRRLITYLLIVNAILALFAVVSRVRLLLQDEAAENWEGDFISFYTGWTMVIQGQGSELYNLEAQTKTQLAMLGGQTFENVDGILPFINPPHSVFPFLPLALLPRHQAFLVWQVINLGILGWVLWRVLQTLARNWTKHERWAVALITLAFTPLLVTFMLGTFSLVVAACFIEALINFERGRDRRGALWLALASIKFPLLILIAVALLAGQRWKAVISGVAFATLAFVGTGLSLGFKVWGDYFALARQLNAFIDRYGIYPLSMPNLKGLLTTLLGKEQYPLIQTLSTVGLLLGCVIAGGLMIRNWKPEQASWKLKVALIITLSIFLSLHLNEHDAILFLVAGLMAYIGVRQSNNLSQSQILGGFLLISPLIAIIPVWGMIILQLGIIIWIGFLLRRSSTLLVAQ